MATTLAAPLPVVANITLSATPGNCSKVTIPANASRVSVKFRTNAGKLSFDSALTDDGAIGASTFIACSADQMYEFRVAGLDKVRGDVLSFYLASATASVVAEVLVEGGPA